MQTILTFRNAKLRNTNSSQTRDNRVYPLYGSHIKLLIWRRQYNIVIRNLYFGVRQEFESGSINSELSNHVKWYFISLNLQDIMIAFTCICYPSISGISHTSNIHYTHSALASSTPNLTTNITLLRNQMLLSYIYTW